MGKDTKAMPKWVHIIKQTTYIADFSRTINKIEEENRLKK